MYLYWLFLKKCNFSQDQYKLPEDGPNGPKHVTANIRYFNVNFNILYVQQKVVTVMTGLLITSERSHYFRKSYLEDRGLTSTKSYADRLTEINLKIP